MQTLIINKLRNACPKFQYPPSFFLVSIANITISAIIITADNIGTTKLVNCKTGLMKKNTNVSMVEMPPIIRPFLKDRL